jgi:16S rRNA (guanine527-N7)-methyltransferase
MNLVGSVAPEALAAQIQESLAGCQRLPRGARVVDLGSGAGLPGVPVAIARGDLAVTLVEGRQKRYHFLRYINRLLDLDCETLRRDLKAGPPGPPYDVALMRAVAPLERSRELAAPWVGPGGVLWLWTRQNHPEGECIASLGTRGAVLQLPCATVSRGTDRV